MLIVGIDPSLTCTSVAISLDGGDPVISRVVSKPPRDGSCAARMARIEGLVAGVMATIEHAKSGGIQGVGIFVEGYSMGSKYGQPAYRHEYGGLLRFYLLDHDPALNEVPPTTLKKFATGKGNAPKEFVMQSVLKHWGYESASNDDADAYALCRLGMYVCNFGYPLNAVQRAVVEQLKKQVPSSRE